MDSFKLVLVSGLVKPILVELIKEQKIGLLSIKNVTAVRIGLIGNIHPRFHSDVFAH